MKKKQLLLFIILLAGLFFLGSMILATNSFVKLANDGSEHYFNQKELFITGKVINSEKVSGRNQLIEIQPNDYHNNIKDTTNTMGFVTADTSKVFLVLNIPKEIDDIDSLSTTATESTFFINSIEIGKSEPELMRWVTMQHLKLETEKSYRINLDYLY